MVLEDGIDVFDRVGETRAVMGRLGLATGRYTSCNIAQVHRSLVDDTGTLEVRAGEELAGWADPTFTGAILLVAGVHPEDDDHGVARIDGHAGG